MEDFKASHPGVTVEIEDLNGQDLDINAKYDTAIAAGNIADLIWVDESYFSKHAYAGSWSRSMPSSARRTRQTSCPRTWS